MNRGDNRFRQRMIPSPATESDSNRTRDCRTEPRPFQMGRTIDQHAKKRPSGWHPDNE